MSKYTITLHDLIKSGYDLGLKNYSIFNENYRPILNKSIIDYYEWHEIGFETPAMFVQRLNAKLDRIMRNEYNALYQAKTIEFNPLYNIELKETFKHNIEGEQETNSNSNLVNKSNTTGTDKTRGFTSRFPEDNITKEDLENLLYADVGNRQENNNTTTDKTEQETTDKGTGKNKQNETYTRMTEGSSAGLPFSKAMLQLKQYYDKYRLDEQVIQELSDLFMTIW